MQIKRDDYLNKLILKKHNKLIKVITGLRRCGKSYLLFTLFARHLLELGVDNEHIIAIQLDRFDYKHLREPANLLNHIKSLIKDEKMHYIMLDEVQFLKNFEEVLNTLLYFDNVDVYVTGSNSKFLSSDVITEFRGRGDELHLYPLSFKEFMQTKDDINTAWNEYIVWGGMPFVATLPTQEQKSAYLQNLFKEVYLKDLIERNNISKTYELESLLDILASNIGALTNPSTIEKTFASKGIKISNVTIKNYIDFLQDCFLISSANRYDVKGRKYIGTPLKYYYEDIGLRNARLNYRQIEPSHIQENIIYNELKSRGYMVDVGVVEVRKMQDGKSVNKSLEVDFVINKADKRIYIQSALSMPSEEKRAQEKQSLINIKDNFKKIIITKDSLPSFYDDDGVFTINLFDFLLDDECLKV